MGVPDESAVPPRKRSRLSLFSTSRKKLKQPETKLAAEVPCKVDRISKKHGSFVDGDDKRDAKSSFISESKCLQENTDPLVAPVATLQNIGNTCFLNCMLQVLRYTPGFLCRLKELSEKIQWLEKSQDHEKPKLSWQVLKSLHTMYQQMFSRENLYHELTPRDCCLMAVIPDTLLEDIRQVNAMFEGNYQQDAQELLRCLLSVLDDAEIDLNAVIVEKANKDSNVSPRLEPDIQVTNATKRKSKEFAPVKEEEQKKSRFSDASVNYMLKFLNNGPNTNSDNKEKTSVSDMDVDEKESLLQDEKQKVRLPTKQDTSKPKSIREHVINGTRNGMKHGFDSHLKLSPPIASSEESNKSTKVFTNSKSCKRLGMTHITFPNTSKPSNKKQQVLCIHSDSCVSRADAAISPECTVTEETSVSKPVGHENKQTFFHDRGSGPEESISHFNTKEDVRTLPCSSTHKESKPPSTKALSEKASNGKSENLPESPSHHVLTQGEDVLVHSPFESSSVGTSGKLFAKLEKYLSQTSKRVLDFSANWINDKAVPFLQRSPGSAGSSNMKIVYTEHDLVHLSSAKVKLKRCDSLGVSPVKSLNLKNMLTGVENSAKRRILLDGDSESMSREVMGNLQNETKISSIQYSLESKGVTAVEGSDHLKKVHDFSASSKLKFQGKKMGEKGIDDKRKDMKQVSIVLERCDKLVNGEGVKMLSNDSLRVGGCCLEKSPFSSPDKMTDSSHHVLNKLASNVGKVSKSGQSQGILMAAGSVKCHCASRFPCHFDQAVKKETPLCTPEEKGTMKNRLLYELFGGVMTHQTCCAECETSQYRKESFMDISIPVQNSSLNTSTDVDADDETNEPRPTVMKALSHRERLRDDNKYFCENCFHLVEAERSCHYTTLPPILTLHLKRFKTAIGSFTGVSKILDHVAVPEILPCFQHGCGKPCMRPGHRYSLYAIVTHSGTSILHGHYRTYVKINARFNPQILKYVYENGLLDTKTFLRLQGGSTIPNMSSPTCGSARDKDHIDLNFNPANSATQFDCNNSNVFNGTRGESVPAEMVLDDVWWIECDDEFAKVMTAVEFSNKLREECGSLLGAPYVLFYHRL